MQKPLHWIEISKSALLNNLSAFRKIVSQKTLIMAMVKANAYGHGIELVSPILSSKVDWFGVNTISEALILRKLKIKNKILVVAPIIKSDIELAVKNNISVCANSLEYLQEISDKPLNIHLKINTGMNRLGISPYEVSQALEIIKDSNLTLEGIYTHFHSSDDDSENTIQQIKIFESVVSETKKLFPNIIAHCANTAATIMYPQSHFDMVRVGIGIYGLWPSDYVHESSKLELTPVLSWKAQIIQRRLAKAGQTVGYGATKKFTQDTMMGIIPVGYSDGLDRKLSNTGNFLGRIAMNLTAIQISDQENIFEIIGPSRTANEIAKTIGTINYEVVARLSLLTPRILVE